MKGVILAGGKGTRMLPATKVTNKHMLPILNTPMIVYPLRTLMFFGVTDILVISGGGHIGHIAEFLGDGSDYGVNLTYKVQKEAGGIADALRLAEGFAGGEGVMVVLGDNIFENTKLTQFLIDKDQACIFLKEVDHPERFGVFQNGEIVEKPKSPESKSAVTGLYYYPNEVFEVVKSLLPSARGETEITDVNNHFLKLLKMNIHHFTGFWSDAGTPESMLEVVEWAGKNLITNKK